MSCEPSFWGNPMCMMEPLPETSRRPSSLCHWLPVQAGTAAGRALTDAGSTRAWGLLTFAPYLVPFHERARVFQSVVSRVGGWVVVGRVTGGWPLCKRGTVGPRRSGLALSCLVELVYRPCSRN